MGLPIARLGDAFVHESGGGVIELGSTLTKVLGQPIARISDIGTCSEHGEVTVASGSTLSKDMGLAIAREGDVMSCGAVIVTTQTFALTV